METSCEQAETFFSSLIKRETPGGEKRGVSLGSPKRGRKRRLIFLQEKERVSRGMIGIYEERRNEEKKTTS